MMRVNLQWLGGRGASAFDSRTRQAIKDMIKVSHGKVNYIDASRFGSLLAAEAQIRDRSREHALIYEDLGESPIAASKGNRHSVSVPTDLLNSKMSLTHNHPDSNFGGTFSTADIAVGTAHNLKSIRAAGKEGTYYLKPGKNADPRGFARRVARDEDMLERRMARESRKISKRVEKGELTWQQAYKMARTVTVGKIHEYYKKVAPKYGYTYGRQKLNKTRR